MLDLSKTVMYEFCYDYVKPKYGENAKLCCMDMDSFIVLVKTGNIYKDIAEDVEQDVDRLLPKGKNKKVIELMKYELGQMNKFVGLRAKRYSYLKYINYENKAKGTKMCVIKRKLKFQDYKNCLEAAAQIENKINYLAKHKIDADGPKENQKEFKTFKLILKTQQKFRSEKHNVFVEEINKIALSSNDDKTIQSIDMIETYAHRTNKGLVCKKEEIKYNNIIKQYKNL